MKKVSSSSSSVLTAAFLGFILSLICGLFSHSNFGKVLITALLFAVIFAVLAVLIKFVYNKFLSVELTSNDNTNISVETPISPVGQHIDFVVEDQELDETDSQNHFDVGDNRQLLDESDIFINQNKEHETIKSGDEFIPIRKMETLKNISGTEAANLDKKAFAQNEQIDVLPEAETNQNVQNAQNVASENISSLNNTSENLDVLPDLSDKIFATDSNSSASESYDSDASDSGFVNSLDTIKNKETTGEIQDSSLMAKAISSILAQES